MLPFLILIAVAALAVPGSLAGRSDLIILPKQPGEAVAALIFIQGANISPESYRPFLEKAQEQFDGPLIVAVPQAPLGIAPIDLKGCVKRAVGELKEAGLPEGAPIFLGGHSLGGAVVQDLAAATDEKTLKAAGLSEPPAGLFLTGAALLRKHRGEVKAKSPATFPVPTLVINGELDGLFRISRTAEEFWHRVKVSSQERSQAEKDFPVVLLAGCNHMLSTDVEEGSAPSFVKSRDLQASRERSECSDEAAGLLSDFLHSHLDSKRQITQTEAERKGRRSPTTRVEAAVKSTEALVDPMLEALTLEGFAHFRPPCNYKASTVNPPSDKCTKGSPWVEYAQSLHGGELKASYRVNDNFHPVWEILPVHLPSVDTTCEEPSASCTLNVTTVSEAIYDKLDGLDTGMAPTAASEIKAKLVSREHLYRKAGVPESEADFHELDETESLCKRVNEEAVKTAEELAGQGAVERFQTWGVKLKMGEDKGPYNAGPLWIWNYLTWKETGEGEEAVATVSAPFTATKLTNPIPAARGFHYCKLLSPARALEWILVDGLRKRMGTGNLQPHESVYAEAEEREETEVQREQLRVIVS